MFELIAQGPLNGQRQSRALTNGVPLVVGRTATEFRVDWDNQISRRHAVVILEDRHLSVEKLPDAANPVFFQGRTTERFRLEPGGHFAIGQTTFTFSNDRALVTLDVPDPISRRTFTSEYLRQVRFRDAGQRIEALNQLPDIISRAGDDSDLMNRMLELLLAGVPAASTVAACRRTGDSIVVVRWEHRRHGSGDFEPSARLILDATDRNETTLHIWNQKSDCGSNYTLDVNNDWAFVYPLGGTAARNLCIYVAGVNRGLEDSGQDDLQGDVKFAELIGATWANLLDVRALEQRQSALRPFFSPLVVDAFRDQQVDQVLSPRECEISVLFCDLQGFARATELMADRLVELLERVSEVLGVVTGRVLHHAGVIGDFHGDSVMGFWGWPAPQTDRAFRACQAALDIIQQFPAGQSADSRFKMGIGIATGPAVAGKIGTRDQVKVTAFGPTVNLAARIEGITRQLGVPIVIEGNTADIVSTPDSTIETRRLGNFLPLGLQTPVELFEVLGQSTPEIRNQCDAYESAIQNFEFGDWPTAAKELGSIQNSDPAARFLKQFIESQSKQPPSDWSGVIELSKK